MFNKTEQEIMENWQLNISNPIVSICCIAYNQEKYIHEALDSFLMQETNFPFEIIIRDDASPDNTAFIIKEYEKKYPNIIKPIYEKENGYKKGIKASSVTFKKAIGEYLAICEGDDYWTDPKKLQIQIDLMRKNPECYLSFHPASELIETKLSGNVFSMHDVKNKIFTDIEMIRKIGNIFCPTASMILRREVMNPIPDFFLSAPVGDDFLQYLSSLNGGALFIARVMSIYRVGHPESWNVMKKKKEEKSIDILTKNQEIFLLKYTKALDEMANLIDKKYRKEINKRISLDLFSLSLLYLNNNMDKEFKIMIEQSKNAYRPTFLLHNLLYYFRFSPNFAKKIVNIRNNVYIKKIYSKLKNIL